MSKKRGKQQEKAQVKAQKEEAIKAKKTIWNVLCIFGFFGALFYLMHEAVGATLYPGYDWMSQAVSDLTASDAPSYAVASSLSSIYGICSCVCCAAMCVLARPLCKMLKNGIFAFTIMNFVSAAGYMMFPLSSSGFDGSFQSIMHMAVTVAVVLLSLGSLAAIMVGFHREQIRFMAAISFFALVFMVGGAIGTAFAPESMFGLVERFSTYSVVLFGAIMGLFFYVNPQALIEARSL